MHVMFLGPGYIIEVVDSNDSSTATRSYSFLVTPCPPCGISTSTAQKFADSSVPNSEIYRIYSEIPSFLSSICHQRWCLLPTSADYNVLTLTGNRTHYAHLASYVYSILASVVLNMAVSGLINIAFETLIRPGFVRTLGNHSRSCP
jgi:hypothetical protein